MNLQTYQTNCSSPLTNIRDGFMKSNLSYRAKCEGLTPINFIRCKLFPTTWPNAIQSNIYIFISSNGNTAKQIHTSKNKLYANVLNPWINTCEYVVYQRLHNKRHVKPLIVMNYRVESVRRAVFDKIRLRRNGRSLQNSSNANAACSWSNLV